MKRKSSYTLILLLSLFILCSGKLTAQSHFRIGTGIGNTYNFTGYDKKPAPLLLQFDQQGIKGLDFLSGGAYFGYSRYKYLIYDSEFKLSLYSFGVRQSLHIMEMINFFSDSRDSESKFDPYASLYEGFVIGIYQGDDAYLEAGIGRFTLRPAIGVTYYPHTNFGLNLEFGKGIVSLLTVGATFRFNN